MYLYVHGVVKSNHIVLQEIIIYYALCKQIRMIINVKIPERYSFDATYELW